MNEQQIMKHARIDSLRHLLPSAVHCRNFLFLFITSILIVDQTRGNVDDQSPQQMLDDVRQLHAHLNRQHRELVIESDEKKQRWQALVERFIFTEDRESSWQNQIQQAKSLLQQDQIQQSLEILQTLRDDLNKTRADFELIGKTIDAEDRAEQTRKDSKMYFMMRVRSKLPAKTLKAYGLMELAKQQRDKGNFSEALQLWDQAEVMVRESFNEHIASMAEWREESAQQAQATDENIRKSVANILAGHLVDIPGGTFLMGSKDGGLDESPQHKVAISPFRMGKTEVTFALYDLCVASTRCYAVPNDQGWGRGDRPVTNVSYRDITEQFLPWLNAVTGAQYRLPSEAEWEYAARAGSDSEYAWGDNITCAMARFDGGSTSVCNAREGKNRGTAPVMTYQPNAFGLYDMHGNVWEWVEDCWNPTYAGAPADGSAWLSGNCELRVMRGGSWDYHKSGLRSPNRYSFSQKVRRPNYGFRLAKDK